MLSKLWIFVISWGKCRGGSFYFNCYFEKSENQAESHIWSYKNHLKFATAPMMLLIGLTMLRKLLSGFLLFFFVLFFRPQTRTKHVMHAMSRNRHSMEPQGVAQPACHSHTQPRNAVWIEPGTTHSQVQPYSTAPRRCTHATTNSPCFK